MIYFIKMLFLFLLVFYIIIQYIFYILFLLYIKTFNKENTFKIFLYKNILNINKN